MLASPRLDRPRRLIPKRPSDPKIRSHSFLVTSLVALQYSNRRYRMLPWLRFIFVTLPVLCWDGSRLTLFVLCMLPGFLRFAWYAWVVSERKSIRYANRSCRQTLDVYHAQTTTKTPRQRAPSISSGRSTPDADDDVPLLLTPVVVFFTGGAWLIGYKLWGALLGRLLVHLGVTVVIPDVRNYPWANVPGMIDDVTDALSWTVQHVQEFGGDPGKIVLVGQSAGGHLACTTLLKQAMEQREREERAKNGTHINGGTFFDDRPAWKATDFCGLISLSAPYDLLSMQATFNRHGLGRDLIDRIFGRQQYEYDTYRIVKDYDADLTEFLPPIQLYHGSHDGTVPIQGAQDFFAELQTVTRRVQFTAYQGWSHTDPILEGPMDADHRFHEDVVQWTQTWTESAVPWPKKDDPILRRLCPHFLIQCGRFFMPF